MYDTYYYKYYGIGMLTDPLWEYVNKRNEQIRELGNGKDIHYNTTNETEGKEA